MFKTVEWKGSAVRLIEQGKLPLKEEYTDYTDYNQVASAIERMVVRGAPAIGVTAAMGAALAAKQNKAEDHEGFFKEFEHALQTLEATRPTAVNLFWAINRMRVCAQESRGKPVGVIKDKLEKEALLIYEEDLAINQKMGENGAEVLDTVSRSPIIAIYTKRS